MWTETDRLMQEAFAAENRYEEEVKSEQESCMESYMDNEQDFEVAKPNRRRVQERKRHAIVVDARPPAPLRNGMSFSKGMRNALGRKK